MQRLLLAVLLSISQQALAQEAQGEEAWLDVSLKGREVSVRAAEFVRHGASLTATPEVWLQAGLVLTPSEKEKDTLSSEELGLSATIDEARSSVVFDGPAHRFPLQQFGKEETVQAPIAPPAKGVLLGYDLALSTDGKQINGSVGHSVKTTLLGNGVLLTTGQLNTTQSGIEYRRGFSTVTWDNPETLRSTQLGDIQSRPATGTSSPVLMGGVRIAKDPTLDVSQPLFAIPVLGGVATDTSTVQAIINGQKRQDLNVRPGEFEILNPGLNTGLNTTQVIVRDEFGREQVIDKRQYFATNTLRQGLSQWEVNVGAVRQGTSNDYKTPGVSASYSRGVSDKLTFDATVEATQESKNASVGVRAYGQAGAISASIGQSQGPHGKGQAYAVSYSYQAPGWSVGANVTHQSDTWWDLSQEAGGKPYSTANLFASKRLNDHWTVSGSVGRSQQGSYKDERADVRVSYSNKNSYLTVSAAKTSQDTAIGVSYTHRFGNRSSTGLDFRKTKHGESYSLHANGQSQMAPGTVYWGARAGQNHNATFASAVARLDASTYQAQAQLDVYDKQPSLSVNYSSGLWMGEGVRQQVKPYGLTIAVVKVPNVEGVPVFLENRLMGKTNKAGVLVIGPLRELEANNIRIDVRALPVGFDITKPTITTAPNRNHVALIEYKSQTENARSFRLIHEGDDVPMGKMLTNGTMVGYFGEVFLDNPQPGQAIEVEGLCKAVLPDTLPEFSETPTVECM